MRIVNQALQVIVNGVLLGGLYGLFSSGLTLIFGITRVVNFAHGDMITIGMYGAIWLSISTSLPPLLAIIPVAGVMLAAGFGLYRFVLQRTITRKGLTSDETETSQMVLTFALSIFIENGLLLVYGPQSRSTRSTLGSSFRLGSIFLNEARLVTFAIACIVFILLYLLLSRSRFGRIVRGTVDDRDMATMLGIDTRMIYTVTFGIGSALAGITGVCLATFYPVTPNTGASFLIIAFVTVVLGGLGSVVGAFFAGIVVGMTQLFTATYISIALQNVAIFVIFVFVLLLRPQGLFTRGGVRV